MANDNIDTIQKAFEQFEREIVRVPKEQNEAAKRLHPQIRETLAKEIPEHLETFLSGSYGRRVQAVRLKDIDIIVVLDDPDGEFFASADVALETIRELARESELVRRTEKSVRSIKLFLHDQEFTIDLVAALNPHNGQDGLLLARRMPEKGLDDWTLEHPRGQLDAASSKNSECGDTYIPSVRLAKYWLWRIWGEKHKPLRSYHAESILYWALNDKLEYADVMTTFFDAAYDALAPGVHTPDPGAPHHFVDELLDDNERFEAREAVKRARKAAHAAYEKDDVEEALDAWVEVFGAAFPAPSTSPEKIEASFAARTAGVVGAGIQVGRGRPVIEARSWRDF